MTGPIFLLLSRPESLLCYVLYLLGKLRVMERKQKVVISVFFTQFLVLQIDFANTKAVRSTILITTS